MRSFFLLSIVYVLFYLVLNYTLFLGILIFSSAFGFIFGFGFGFEGRRRREEGGREGELEACFFQAGKCRCTKNAYAVCGDGDSGWGHAMPGYGYGRVLVW